MLACTPARLCRRQRPVQVEEAPTDAHQMLMLVLPIEGIIDTIASEWFVLHHIQDLEEEKRALGQPLGDQEGFLPDRRCALRSSSAHHSQRMCISGEWPDIRGGVRPWMLGVPRGRAGELFVGVQAEDRGSPWLALAVPSSAVAMDGMDPDVGLGHGRAQSALDAVHEQLEGLEGAGVSAAAIVTTMHRRCRSCGHASIHVDGDMASGWQLRTICACLQRKHQAIG
mmetsp:Transcript_168749/g.542336  ORF Transcript_168749/g.542336 Transcript_168749/m.542336 type:complete len:226 (+) Transcript_168749:2422-3099(+)